MVKASRYAPDRGDLIWIDFNPQRGHEQANKRPAAVLSRKAYNVKAGLALMCPITSQVKGYPFEISIATSKVSGVILADQIKSLDWRARQISFIQKLPPETIRELQEKVVLLLTE